MLLSLSARPVALFRRRRPRRLVLQFFECIRHQPTEHGAQHGYRDEATAAAFLRCAARHEELRHDRLVDLGQRIGETPEILLGEAVFRTAIGVHGELGRLRGGGADRERAVGFAPALKP